VSNPGTNLGEKERGNEKLYAATEAVERLNEVAPANVTHAPLLPMLRLIQDFCALNSSLHTANYAGS
jgi:hypothetical protein